MSLLTKLEQALRRIFSPIETGFGYVFDNDYNPFYKLGALGFYFYYIVVVSGIYLFIFYDPNVKGSFDTIEYLTHEQWYLGGIMRSLHRYASDGLVLAVVLHILREFSLGRYRGARWFTWLTGLPPLILIFPSGLIGYWLVWDKLAQFIAVRTTEWFDWLPIVSEPSAHNFLTNTSISDLFFRLILIIHIVLPIFMFVGLLVHVKKINKSRTNPPRNLALGTLLSFLALSLAVPALSHARADLSIVPVFLNFDWFYMFIYPLMDLWSMGTVWAVVAATTLLLTILPWLTSQRREPVAEVFVEKCSGCNLCVVECPYEAIRLQPRSDDHPHYIREALVITDNCVSCGICTGSCPSLRIKRPTDSLKTGIDLPQGDVQHLYTATQQALASERSNAKILVYGCDHGLDMNKLIDFGVAKSGVVALSLPCTGALPPAFIAYALNNGADGVLITGCRMGDCYNRLGNMWTEQRLGLGKNSKKRVSQWLSNKQVAVQWAGSGDEKKLRQAIERLRQDLQN